MFEGKAEITILNLGAGVQSSTLALMAEKGFFKKPDCAIFADTGGEPDLHGIGFKSQRPIILRRQ